MWRLNILAYDFHLVFQSHKIKRKYFAWYYDCFSGTCSCQIIKRCRKSRWSRETNSDYPSYPEHGIDSKDKTCSDQMRPSPTSRSYTKKLWLLLTLMFSGKSYMRAHNNSNGSFIVFHFIVLSLVLNRNYLRENKTKLKLN